MVIVVMTVMGFVECVPDAQSDVECVHGQETSVCHCCLPALICRETHRVLAAA